ncbi:hypothetical protein SASPL_147974 [Salvia splendens]|uniref:AIG1-type G domain-containing protein n=1 Tax=Salvia splendens TaxID=180675 RepID=A0A8X8Z3Y2_SALSN|nr:hypothetical protein SASPL_147974 [Salvia splendens]
MHANIEYRLSSLHLHRLKSKRWREKSTHFKCWKLFNYLGISDSRISAAKYNQYKLKFFKPIRLCTLFSSQKISIHHLLPIFAMGGYRPPFADCVEVPPLIARTVVLVGKMGNGKSATANRLIGRQVFESMPSLGAVTSSCKLETTDLGEGRILNVVDTPGLFDSSVEPKVMANEIAQCINLAKDGIHAVLLVLSLRNRFSEEEALAFDSICKIFGGKIQDYMIIVFTNGDILRSKNLTLDAFLACNCPEQLKNTIAICGNRVALFDNVSGDEGKIFAQREELLSLVEDVVEENGGKPYTNELFDELTKGGMDTTEQAMEFGFASKSVSLYEAKFERLIQMVEMRLRECILRLEKQLAEERALRAEAEEKALAAQIRARDEMFELRERLGRAEAFGGELQHKINSKQGGFCAVM